MNKPPFTCWLKGKFKKRGKYVDDRFGDLAKNLSHVIESNPFDEDFDDYNTLEDWLEHLDMHMAPDCVHTTMVDAWSLYTSEGITAEVECISGDKNGD